MCMAGSIKSRLPFNLREVALIGSWARCIAASGREDPLAAVRPTTYNLPCLYCNMSLSLAPPQRSNHSRRDKRYSTFNGAELIYLAFRPGISFNRRPLAGVMRPDDHSGSTPAVVSHGDVAIQTPGSQAQYQSVRYQLPRRAQMTSITVYLLAIVLHLSPRKMTQDRVPPISSVTQQQKNKAMLAAAVASRFQKLRSPTGERLRLELLYLDA